VVLVVAKRNVITFENVTLVIQSTSRIYYISQFLVVYSSDRLECEFLETLGPSLFGLSHCIKFRKSKRWCFIHSVDKLC
jgi:hypothetical protein